MVLPWGSAIQLPADFGDVPKALIRRAALAEALAAIDVPGTDTVTYYLIKKSHDRAAAANKLLYYGVAVAESWTNPNRILDIPDDTPDPAVLELRSVRIDTSYGLFLSGERATALVSTALERRREKQEDEQRRKEEQNAQVAVEAVLRGELVAAGYLPAKDMGNTRAVTVTLLKEFYDGNASVLEPILPNSMAFSKAKSRKDKVAVLTNAITALKAAAQGAPVGWIPRPLPMIVDQP